MRYLFPPQRRRVIRCFMGRPSSSAGRPSVVAGGAADRPLPGPRPVGREKQRASQTGPRIVTDVPGPRCREIVAADQAHPHVRRILCDICTPPFTHAGLIEGIAVRGFHVLCEKPLAPTLAEGRKIEEVVRAAG